MWLFLRPALWAGTLHSDNGAQVVEHVQRQCAVAAAVMMETESRQSQVLGEGNPEGGQFHRSPPPGSRCSSLRCAAAAAVAPVLIALRCSRRSCGLLVAQMSPALRCAALSPKMRRLTWKLQCLTWRILTNSSFTPPLSPAVEWQPPIPPPRPTSSGGD